MRQIGGVVNHSAQRLWPLWVFESCISTHAHSAVKGRADSLKTVSRTRQGRIWSPTVQVRSTHFPAYITGNDLWAPEKRALETSISCLDGKASRSRSESRSHSRERKDLGEAKLLAFDLFLLIAPSRLL